VSKAALQKLVQLSGVSVSTPLDAVQLAAAVMDKKPYGDVEYADSKNGLYPIDAKHVKAAWSYINQPEKADKYPMNGVTLKEVKDRIIAAMKKYGHEVNE
jgi:hypothetical protein